jgi:hypothetical protein
MERRANSNNVPVLDRWIVDIRWTGRRSELLELYAVRSDDQMDSRMSPPKHKNPSK